MIGMWIEGDSLTALLWALAAHLEVPSDARLGVLDEGRSVVPGGARLGVLNQARSAVPGRAHPALLNQARRPLDPFLVEREMVVIVELYQTLERELSISWWPAEKGYSPTNR